MEIFKLLKYSGCKIYNALEHVKQHGATNNVKQQPRTQKTSAREDSLTYKVAANKTFTGSSLKKNDNALDFVQ